MHAKIDVPIRQSQKNLHLLLANFQSQILLILVFSNLQSHMHTNVLKSNLQSHDCTIFELRIWNLIFAQMF